MYKRKRAAGGSLGASGFVIAIYLVSGTVGGLLTGLLLGGVASLWQNVVKPSNWWGVTFLALALVLEAAGRSFRWFPPQRNKETPRSWTSRPPEFWGLATGLVLGSGVATRIRFSAWYIAPIIIVLFGSVASGAVIMGVYGLTRVTMSEVLFRETVRGTRIWAVPRRLIRGASVPNLARVSVLLTTAGVAGILIHLTSR
jgi:hypothetical protein